MADETGYPEEGELVLCTVKDIMKTIVFVYLDEYSKTGVVTTAEIAPGRIRNIRDYVIPNKKIVCKVLRIDKAKGHIDLSFRRVSLKERIASMAAYKKERSAISLLNKIVQEKSKADKIIADIKGRYRHLSSFLELARENPNLFKEFSIPEKESEQLLDAIKERIKSRKIFVKAKIKIKDIQAVGTIKEILKTDKKNAKITYISAPSYFISVEGNEYKEANKVLMEIIEGIKQKVEKAGGEFSSEIEKMS